MFDVREYSPSDVVLTFGGTRVEGWNKITVRQQHPTFVIVHGIRGKNTRKRINNTAAEIELSLDQTSPTNTILSEIVKLDAQYGTGRIELTLKDTLTGESFSSTDAFIEGYADKGFDSDLSDRVWKIHCLTSYSTMGTGGALGSLVDKVSSFF